MNQHGLDLQSPKSEYRTIVLTQGQVTVVDASDYEWLTQWKWYAHWDRKLQKFYATRNLLKAEGIQHFVPSRKRPIYGAIRMHRAIMNMKDPFQEMQVDHIDHDTLNNRRCNLRAATPTQNQYNVKLRADNTSGFRGVSRYKDKWRVQISVNGRIAHVGYFATPDSASDAYVAAAKQLHGDFYNPTSQSRLLVYPNPKLG